MRSSLLGGVHNDERWQDNPESSFLARKSFLALSVAVWLGAPLPGNPGLQIVHAQSCPNPGLYDIDGSGLVGPGDIIRLIDGINGPNSSDAQYDIDGSGVADGQDVQALITGISACRGIGASTNRSGSATAGSPHLHVTLAPSSPGPYPPNSTVTVEVFIARTQAGADIPLRLIQFDVDDTDASLDLDLPITHPAAMPDAIAFWVFSSTPTCTSTPANCGFNYFIDDAITIDTILNTTYVGLSQNLNFQLVIPGNTTPLHVGTISVTVPGSSGVYGLDLMNADNPDVNFGAMVAFSFTSTTFWYASQGDISGGTLDLVVEGGQPVPALSEWGLGVITLLGLIAGTLVFREPR